MEFTKVFAQHGFMMGKMLTSSKSSYRNRYPDNLVVFNANVFVDTPEFTGKIWYGDIDLTTEHQKLKDIATKLGTTLYVLWESDGRFENESRNDFKKIAVWNSDSGIAEGYKSVYVMS